jgi:UDP-4-amino-4,6-dideoxy-N-acetyl-beta-L-altrosamine transaminase
MNRIPYGKQHIDELDLESVANALQDDFITTGPKVLKFEQEFAQYVGAKYAVAVSNGTAALHLSALALNIKPGDKVITTPITFLASANCVLYAGGEVDFVDIDPDTYLMDLDKLEEKLENAPPQTYKGIVPVDFAGYPVNMEKLKQIADKYGLWILEDACHAPGGFFFNSKNEKVMCGSCRYSEAAIFSFHPVKHIATGEGGMITTNNATLYQQLCTIRNHGITKNPELLRENHGGWYYEMVDLGFNYRLTDIQAALGMSQLKKADKGLQRRKEITEKYDKAFENTFLKIPGVSEMVSHAYHLYVVLCDRRKELYNYLQENNIFSQIHYIPVHLQPYYKENFGWKSGDFPVAEDYYQKCISLPVFPSLTDAEQDYVIQKVLDFS